MKNKLKILCAAVVVGVPVVVADDYEDFLKSANESYAGFRDEANAQYRDFLEKANRDYADFLSKPWEPKPIEPPRVQPKEKPVPVTVNPDPRPLKPSAPKPLPQPKPLPPAQPKPQPKPIEDIKPVAAKTRPFSFRWFGTEIRLELPVEFNPRLGGADEGSVSRAWSSLASDQKGMNVAKSLLDIRTSRNLCDWAYFTLVSGFANAVAGTNDHNLSALVEGFILSQSGYDTRLCISGGGVLDNLVASDETVWNHSFVKSDGRAFYFISGKAPAGGLRIVGQSFPGARQVDFAIDRQPALDLKPTATRRWQCVHYPELTVEVESNQNLLDFFASCPSVSPAADEPAKYRHFADTPLAENVKGQIYPALKGYIAGKPEREAADILIDFCESIPYKLDEEMWGYDRIFFADETLHYSHSDCEDHAILFTRLVRDLLGLKTALIYYPGHLAAAVEFSNGPHGSYITSGRHTYTVCDPTIFYAQTGVTMQGMDNSTATLIPLD